MDDRFRVLVSGAPGPDYAVYACSNLAQPAWSMVLNTNPPALPFLFVDPLGTNKSQRYYRLLLGP